jgi:lipopolysaccharide transport system permease protein
VKYEQAVLGGLWAIIQPFFSMVVFTFFFGKLAKMPSEGIPYPILTSNAKH